jgi:hypothetical protein
MRNEKETTTFEETEISVLDETTTKENPMATWNKMIESTKQVEPTKSASADSKFQELLNQTMKRRWGITAIVLLTFLFIAVGISMAVHGGTVLDQEWKEILLLMLGAFIGSYGKIIDYWFSDTDKDKMLVQKMDEEDGQSFSNTLGG